eukprot:m.253637 g.253637  ORF g.253637 m.253637 type:complete len:224 (-) comp19588_c0_seq1:326-997(-)
MDSSGSGLQNRRITARRENPASTSKAGNRYAASYNGMIETEFAFPTEGSMEPSDFIKLANLIQSSAMKTKAKSQKAVLSFVSPDHVSSTDLSKLPPESKARMRAIAIVSPTDATQFALVQIQHILSFRVVSPAGGKKQNKEIHALLITHHPDPSINLIVCHHLVFGTLDILESFYSVMQQMFQEMATLQQQSETKANNEALSPSSRKMALVQGVTANDDDWEC